jgi:hypothetical protein
MLAESLASIHEGRAEESGVVSLGEEITRTHRLHF